MVHIYNGILAIKECGNAICSCVDGPGDYHNFHTKSSKIDRERQISYDITGGEKDDRGQDGWMAVMNQWPWVRASSRRWWGTGKLGMLQSMGLQRVWNNCVTEQQHMQKETKKRYK